VKIRPIWQRTSWKLIPIKHRKIESAFLAELPSCRWNSRPGGDLGTGRSDTNHNTLAPTFMTSLQSLPHHIHIARRIKREIRTSIGHLYNLVDDGRSLGEFGGVDEIRRAEFQGEVFLAVVGIDGDDLGTVFGSCSLEDGETDTADSEDGDLSLFYGFQKTISSADTTRHEKHDT
jgi:hypothetical protein